MQRDSNRRTASGQDDDGLEAKITANGAEPLVTALSAGMSDAAGFTGTASSEPGGRVRGSIAAGWRFTRHLLEMVLAMVAGMAALDLALGALGEPPGYAHPLVEYGLMGASMSAPMVAWMRHRGHSWSDGMEMTAAMLVPAFVLVFAAEWGPASSVFSLSGSTPTMLSHLAMVAGMAALMVYRWDRYAHRAHGRSA